MMKTIADSDSDRAGAAGLVVKAAHFDITVVSAAGFHGTPDNSGHPANLLVKGLTSRNMNAAWLDCASCGETGFPLTLRSNTSARYPTLHKVVALQPNSQVGEDDGRQARSYPDRVFYAAAKLLCVDDQLFKLKGGSEFARMSVSAARRAGRTAVLLCADLPTVFINRQEIVDAFDGRLDYVVGEPPAVLSLFGLSRIDTLIPRSIQLGTGLVLHRIGHPSISVRPKSSTIEFDDTPISREAFWSGFVPCKFDEFLASATG